MHAASWHARRPGRRVRPDRRGLFGLWLIPGATTTVGPFLILFGATNREWVNCLRAPVLGSLLFSGCAWYRAAGEEDIPVS